MARNIMFTLATDFTGGLNLRADQFQLAPNESPGLINVEIDPRGGVFSRAGFRFLHSSPVSAAVWNPKSLYSFRGDTAVIMLSTGYINYTSGEVHKSTGGNFSRLNLSSGNLNITNPDGASFTQWEETLYFVGGYANPYAYKWKTSDAYASTLQNSGAGAWQPYETPTGGYMPRANLCKVHANKMFVAGTYEDGTYYPNRLRWSHDGRPEDWFDQDYIDITAGGIGIRAIEIVDGQLLIFKQNAIYLLLGYDVENFQLVEVSTIHGVDYPQQVAAGDGGVYFFDYPKGLFFYNRNGVSDIFLRIAPIITDNEINTSALDAITCSFVNTRLWLSMPYNPDTATTTPPAYPGCNFIFDQSIGKYGAYTLFRSSNQRGLVVGTDWRSSNDDSYHLMCHSNYPFVCRVDDYEYDTDEQYVDSTINDADFETYYVTSWFYDDRYVQLKSFVGPNYVMKEVNSDTSVRVNVYYNFNSTQIIRTQDITLSPYINGSVYGTGAYGTAEYGTSDIGAKLYKGRRLGRANAVQLEFIGPSISFTDTPGRKWGLNSLAYKYKRRNIKG
jgi:hypothetical protein